MTMIKHHGVLALLAVAMGLATSLPAAAQDRSEVREVLNRAETQAARRAVEDLLGSLSGIGRAEAQTLPPRAPEGSAQPAAQPPTAQAPATTAGTAPVAAAPITAPTAVDLSATPGTPAQPTMIVRVPAAPGASVGVPGAEAPAVATAPEATAPQGQVSTTAAPTPASSRRLAPATATAGRPAAGAPVSVTVRLASGRMGNPNWCPPGR